MYAIDDEDGGERWRMWAFLEGEAKLSVGFAVRDKSTFFASR